ncbi:MarR family transcriptional regulator [Bacteroides sp.]|jgi:transcriptional regulator, MarR family|uniref:MarR family winged helix-turn-helix transcriptional regulator n=1 Tax=Bacteroides sp. TaxID=29523 RepID=UPI00261A0514|nr:MarR family transcriptional regulator [Bacteroides sp.]MDD3038066.1 MarR family transcriptional regulator [Bacteroides sp.]
MKSKIKEDISLFSRLITEAEEKAKENSDAKDLTSTQINYLETIQELGNPNITELSATLGLKKPSVTIVVDRLIMKGCIYKTHSDDDRRSSHLHLTEVGKQINLRHDFAHEYLAEMVTKKLDSQELKTFSELLNKIITDKK